MYLNASKVENFAKKAPTRELLDRVTFYRKGMEAGALVIFENELSSRGITPSQILAHETLWKEKILWDREGLPKTCCKCINPAVGLGKAWVRFFGVIPLIPYQAAYCEEHLK